QEPDGRAPTLTEAVPPAAFQQAARKTRKRQDGPAPKSASASPASSRDTSSRSADDWFADLESEWTATSDHAGADALPADTDVENWTIEFPPEDHKPEARAASSDGAALDQVPERFTDQPGAAEALEVKAPDPFDAPAEAIATPEAPASEARESAQPVEASGDTQAIGGGASGVDVVTEIPDDDDGIEAEPAPVYVPPRRRVSRASVAWALGCVLLALLLAAQLAWANRIELVRNPATQAWMARICDTVSCNLPLIKDTAKLELLSRDVRPNPIAAGALTITATVRNNAAFSQPWPVVVVELNDLDNRPVAMRRFRPSEYMTDRARRDAGIAAGATAAVAFEVADPGRRAVAFQFGFE
ncbi:MAG TPA: DUF3426 domain-containing protein, partial [Rhodanobacteraceae bacterium]|nr:DUF3426 domain-containing protein [Rhodanobacteraceae bacterium]